MKPGKYMIDIGKTKDLGLNEPSVLEMGKTLVNVRYNWS